MGAVQRCRWDFKSGWASSNVVGIICPLVIIGLTELPNSGKAKAHPAQPLAAALLIVRLKTPQNLSAQKFWISMTKGFIGRP